MSILAVAGTARSAAESHRQLKNIGMKTAHPAGSAGRQQQMRMAMTDQTALHLVGTGVQHAGAEAGAGAEVDKRSTEALPRLCSVSKYA